MGALITASALAPGRRRVTDRAVHVYTGLAQQVREVGLLRRARGFYLALGAGLLLGLGGAVTGFVLLDHSWLQLLIAGAFGVLFTQVAFLGHEASHRQVLSSGKGNDRVGWWLAVALVGISYSWWMDKHTRHHGNPNRIGKDPDIEVDTVSFIAEDAAASRGLLRWITRHQGLFFVPLLLLEGLNLHAKSVRSLWRTRTQPGRRVELAVLAGRFVVVLTVVFASLPLGMAFAFLGVQLAVFGLYMGASFAPNHIGMAVVPREEKLDFFSKQVRTSRNVSGGWWATALMGGLNYQIEHHLFPSMARPHLAAARRLVREHCRAHDVAYTETNLVSAWGIVLRYMNQVGLSARHSFSCPALASLR
ncbi:fatty acid desaturase [Friedmanniella endophytica]|uniref:Fatty acid desaturase n=1 Tax=Microlunatus kandeliicorticis TaxID=1759536 RepID=A0A7W3IVI2_9ACTN|nr:acyl-CoA desaturase [Microlunatus kandeliicorticis]MBA8796046.1 fatty acid desaturase [Microlunatus kandeliicorticis]